MVTQKKRGKPKQNGQSGRALLDVRDLAPHDYIRVNGTAYELTPLDSFGLRSRARILALASRLEELELLARADTASDDDEAEYDRHLRELTRLAVPGLPEDMLAKIGTGTLADLGASFFAWADRMSPLNDETKRLLRSVRPSLVSPSSTAPVSGSSSSPTQ